MEEDVLYSNVFILFVHINFFACSCRLLDSIDMVQGIVKEFIQSFYLHNSNHYTRDLTYMFHFLLRRNECWSKFVQKKFIIFPTTCFKAAKTCRLFHRSYLHCLHRKTIKNAVYNFSVKFANNPMIFSLWGICDINQKTFMTVSYICLQFELRKMLNLFYFCRY